MLSEVQTLPTVQSIIIKQIYDSSSDGIAHSNITFAIIWTSAGIGRQARLRI